MAGSYPTPAHNTQNEVGPAADYARSQPDYSTSWNTHLEPELLEFSPVVVNVVFTGHAERHEAAIRKVWDGPLCIVARDVPTARVSSFGSGKRPTRASTTSGSKCFGRPGLLSNR